MSYEGQHVSGDLSPQEYQEALGIVKPRLQPSEHVTELEVCAQAPKHSSSVGDLLVRTCSANCGDSDAGRGRIFVLERVNGALGLSRVLSWIAPASQPKLTPLVGF
jgi:hypothetical protein